MAEYVHFTCGPYHFLVRADAVGDVVTLSEPPGLAPLLALAEAEMPLPVLPLREVMDLPAQLAGAAMTCTGGDRPRMVLAVDRILGREDIPEGNFQPPPPLPSRLAGMADAAWADGCSGRPILRCRHPLPWSSSAARWP